MRWVDTNKGDAKSPNYRSRLVAQEFARGEHRDDLFAGTPPLSAARLMISEMVLMLIFGRHLPYM